MTSLREIAVSEKTPLLGALLATSSSAQINLSSGLILCVRCDIPPAALMKMGGYNRISTELTEDSICEYCVNRTRTLFRQIIVRLAAFDQTIASGGEATCLLRKYGYEPCAGFELLEFGITYPQFQQQFPVLELGKMSGKDADCPTMLCLDGNDLARSLDLARYDMELSARCRYLVTERASD